MIRSILNVRERRSARVVIKQVIPLPGWRSAYFFKEDSMLEYVSALVCAVVAGKNYDYLDLLACDGSGRFFPIDAPREFVRLVGPGEPDLHAANGGINFEATRLEKVLVEFDKGEDD
jgi:hypothetical protein